MFGGMCFLIFYSCLEMSFKSGHRIIPLVFEEAEKVKEHFRGYRNGTIRLDPDGWFLTTHFITFADKFFDFKFKRSDVVIMTYPKCGSTWVQEIVWNMLFNPNFDNPEASLPITIRSPFLDLDFIQQSLLTNPNRPGSFLHDYFVRVHPERNPKDGISIQFAELAKDPRIIKTHLSFPLLSPSLPEACKMIYIARDPKDVAVSYYHHKRLFRSHSYVGSLSDFVDHFVNDTLLWGPFWKHIKQAWSRRNHPNMHFMFYEDLKADPKGEILRLKNFLNVDLREDQINKIVNYTSFDEMKKIEEKDKTDVGANVLFNTEIKIKDGGFFRKGETGDYRNKLSGEDIEKINKWIKENTKDMEDEFKYKIK